MDLIKRCPACGEESEASALRCRCGTLLAHVDLTPSRAASTLTPPPAEPSPASPSKAIVCPHADCAQPNAADAVRCVYCDRALLPSPRARIDWPWGESSPIAEELLVGRVPPADARLIERLAHEFDNVSRRHAILRCSPEGVTLEDLGSSNGTFVNEVRLPSGRPVRLHDGARVRFAADLAATVHIDD